MKKENQFLISKINNATKIFDACGVYDDSGAIPYPSTHPNFADAMTFLEWYGLQMMPGFGFVIVDNMTEDGKVKVADYKGILLQKLQDIIGLDAFNETTTENDPQFVALLDCFNSGKSLAINGAALIFAASMLSLF